MSQDRQVFVHLVPEWVPTEGLAGGVAVVIDVLRFTTTSVYALVAGARKLLPCREVEEARDLAGGMRAGRVLLAGERQGKTLPGFDLGNSPLEYTPARVRQLDLVMTTTNGTRALLAADTAERIWLAAFVNFSAVCEQLRTEARPVHIICAGDNGRLALEDTLCAGGLVDFLCRPERGPGKAVLNDAARVAWDAYEVHGPILEGAMQVSSGGLHLTSLGYAEDVRVAGRIDQFTLVPELRRDPLRVEIGAVGIAAQHWLHGC
jgi:2-phosphosulfolactate phosphatase